MASPRRKRPAGARTPPPRRQTELPLDGGPAASEPPVPPKIPRYRRNNDVLWACLYFPDLALDVFASAQDSAPRAVVEGEGGRRQVIACDSLAGAGGVAAGMNEAAALALLPQLRCLERQVELEHCALERLATRAGQFSSEVSIEAPDVVLLEIGASLKLFGGFEVSLARVQTDFTATAYRFVSACAPTPSAAVLLARAGGSYARDQAQMRTLLAAVPAALLPWPRDALARLEGMGVRSLRDCLRLPRDGLARRFGPDALQMLDRLMGRAPDPRRRHVPSPDFSAAIELPAESIAHGLLMEAASRLLDELADELHRHQSGVQRLRIGFGHRRQETTWLELGLAQASGDAAYLRRVLDERLRRLVLAAPVHRISVHAGRFVPLSFQVTDAFAGRATATEAMALVDDLRARLGEEAVCSLCLVPEHRPEAAWRKSEPGSRSSILPPVPRPFWLLEEPRLLAIHEGRPIYRGKLRILNGPERIEAGWWDGGDIARDYYMAVTCDGVRLWLFRERRGQRRWFLHGVFA